VGRVVGLDVESADLHGSTRTTANAHISEIAATRNLYFIPCFSARLHASGRALLFSTRVLHHDGAERHRTAWRIASRSRRPAPPRIRAVQSAECGYNMGRRGGFAVPLNRNLARRFEFVNDSTFLPSMNVVSSARPSCCFKRSVSRIYIQIFFIIS
jgi:hypothetical protein